MYFYFKKYKVIAIYLSQQQTIDADPKAIEQINFAGNLDQSGNTMFIIIEEANETILDFKKELSEYCKFILL